MGNLFACDFFGSRKAAEQATAGDAQGSDGSTKAIEGERIARFVCFGAGCYWGTEKYFHKEFNKQFPGGVIDGMVGFMGPASAPKNPSYKDVCSGTTGHVEVYRLEFDGTPRMFEELVLFFYKFHDPTVLNKQGNDKGTQYASCIFCYDDAQAAIAKRVTARVQQWLSEGKINKKQYASDSITTQIQHVRECSEFFPAHDEHQRYLELHPKGYCNHRIRIKYWPQDTGAGSGPDAGKGADQAEGVKKAGGEAIFISTDV